MTRIASLTIKDECRPIGVRNVGSAFAPKYTWKCRCGAHGTSKVEDKAQAALDKHIEDRAKELAQEQV